MCQTDTTAAALGRGDGVEDVRALMTSRLLPQTSACSRSSDREHRSKVRQKKCASLLVTSQTHSSKTHFIHESKKKYTRERKKKRDAPFLGCLNSFVKKLNPESSSSAAVVPEVTCCALPGAGRGSATETIKYIVSLFFSSEAPVQFFVLPLKVNLYESSRVLHLCFPAGSGGLGGCYLCAVICSVSPWRSVMGAAQSASAAASLSQRSGVGSRRCSVCRFCQIGPGIRP